MSLTAHARALTVPAARGASSPIRQHWRAPIAARPADAVAPQMVAQFAHAGSAMCEAQRIDYKAAREGRMTWQQYFLIWGTRKAVL